ncbi:MAG: hypothetical protein FJX03_07705 [Alphaproteobacteria bacterium]|nr:hypothetical protein [Alphaproteobacteria bacterium]
MKSPEKYYQAPSADVWTDQLRIKIEAAITLMKRGNVNDISLGKSAIESTYNNIFYRYQGDKRDWALGILSNNLYHYGVEDDVELQIYKYQLNCRDNNAETHAANNLLRIARNNKHSLQFRAALILHSKPMYNSNAVEIIGDISRQSDHPNQHEALEKLSACLLL